MDKRSESARRLRPLGDHVTQDSSALFDNLITFNELLLMLKHQYSKYTIYRWIQRDGMPHKKLKGKLWFPKREVLLWLERSS